MVEMVACARRGGGSPYVSSICSFSVGGMCQDLAQRSEEAILF